MRPPAAARRPAVARLRAAGARADRPHQHDASSPSPGVGINPHHGTPANPARDARAAPRIPGGSTSGGAVSVATGAAWVGARLRHRRLDPHPGRAARLVGFKNTARLTPTRRRAAAVDHAGHRLRDDALGARRDRCCTRSWPRARVDARPRPAGRLPPGRAAHAACSTAWTPTVARAFERSLRRLRDAGARIEEIALPELARAGSDQGHRRLRGGRELGLAPQAAGRAQATATTRACAPRIRRGAGMKAARLHRPACMRAQRLDRPHGGGAARLRRPAVAHRADRRAAHRPGRARRRATTRSSSASTPCCCATPASSTCSTAARSRCPAMRPANSRSA